MVQPYCTRKRRLETSSSAAMPSIRQAPWSTFATSTPTSSLTPSSWNSLRRGPPRRHPRLQSGLRPSFNIDSTGDVRRICVERRSTPVGNLYACLQYPETNKSSGCTNQGPRQHLQDCWLTTAAAKSRCSTTRSAYSGHCRRSCSTAVAPRECPVPVAADASGMT